MLGDLFEHDSRTADERGGSRAQPPALRTGVAALVGRSAIVLEEVTEHGGRVRIDGEDWSSRPYDESLVIPVGTKVDVMQIKGAIALVYPRE